MDIERICGTCLNYRDSCHFGPAFGNCTKGGFVRLVPPEAPDLQGCWQPKPDAEPKEVKADE